jgi:predicted ATPase
VRWHTGDHVGGTEQMQEGLKLLREQGQTVYLPLMRVRLAETMADGGHHDAAVATIDAELAGMRQGGQCWFLAEAHRAYGEVICRSRPADLETAERAFACAIGVARDQSARQFELLAARSLARVWAGQGRSAEPVGLLAILSEADAVPH